MSNALFNADPAILGGEPVFSGTRVPIAALTDYLKSGDTIDTFLEDFPSVTRDQVFAALDRAMSALTAQSIPSAPA